MSGPIGAEVRVILAHRGVDFDPLSGCFTNAVPGRPGTHWCRFSTAEEAKLFDGGYLHNASQDNAEMELVMRRARAMRLAIDRALAGQVVWSGDLREPRS